MKNAQNSGITLKKTSKEIAKFKAINGPGVYEVYAGNSNWVEQEGLPEGKYIIGVKAIAKHNVDKFLALFDGVDEIAIEDLTGLTMTANRVVNKGKASVPMKNQLVKILVDYVDNRDKTAKVLAIVDIDVPKAMKGSTLFSTEESDSSEETGRISATENEAAIATFENAGKKVIA